MLSENTVDQLCIGLFGVTAIYLSQDLRLPYQRWACVFGLVGQVFWFDTMIRAKQWGVVVLCCFYTALWLRGFYNYWIKR